MNVVSLVSFSTIRDCFLEKSQNIKDIETKLHNCFKNLTICDSMPSSFNLNQDWFETTTTLATSFGLMDFVELSIKDSVWLNELYLTGKLDIRVSYIENYNKDSQSYQNHTSFPNTEFLTMSESDEERRKLFSKEIENMVKTNSEIKYSDKLL